MPQCRFQASHMLCIFGKTYYCILCNEDQKIIPQDTSLNLESSSSIDMSPKMIGLAAERSARYQAYRKLKSKNLLETKQSHLKTRQYFFMFFYYGNYLNYFCCSSRSFLIVVPEVIEFGYSAVKSQAEFTVLSKAGMRRSTSVFRDKNETTIFAELHVFKLSRQVNEHTS